MSKILRMSLGAMLLAVSCAAPAHAGEDQFFGLVTGATLGGIVGNQFGHGDGRVAATTAGVLAGGWIGNDIGRSMDNRNLASPVGSYTPSPAAPINYQTSYTPNYVGPGDSPAPESVYDDDYGGYCRPYSEQVRIGDHVQETYGTACLQPDGSWRAVDQ